jgi:hypothetical protein
MALGLNKLPKTSWRHRCNCLTPAISEDYRPSGHRCELAGRAGTPWLARAYALEAVLPTPAIRRFPGTARDAAPAPPNSLLLAKARAAFQDVFELWKDADPDVPLRLAKIPSTSKNSASYGRVLGRSLRTRTE